MKQTMILKAMGLAAGLTVAWASHALAHESVQCGWNYQSERICIGEWVRDVNTGSIGTVSDVEVDFDGDYEAHVQFYYGEYAGINEDVGLNALTAYYGGSYPEPYPQPYPQPYPPNPYPNPYPQPYPHPYPPNPYPQPYPPAPYPHPYPPAPVPAPYPHPPVPAPPGPYPAPGPHPGPGGPPVIVVPGGGPSGPPHPGH